HFCRPPTGRVGECRSEAAVDDFEARWPTAEATTSRSLVLDSIDEVLEELEIVSFNRSTRYRRRLASKALQAVLVEVAPVEKPRTAASICSDLHFDPNSEAGFREWESKKCSRSTESLAKSIRGAAHRKRSTRVPQPRDRPR